MHGDFEDNSVMKRNQCSCRKDGMIWAQQSPSTRRSEHARPTGVLWLRLED